MFHQHCLLQVDYVKMLVTFRLVLFSDSFLHSEIFQKQDHRSIRWTNYSQNSILMLVLAHLVMVLMFCKIQMRPSLSIPSIHPIVTAALAYQDPISLETYILCFPQSLYIESLDTNLLCPFQLRNTHTIIEAPLYQQLQINDHGKPLSRPRTDKLERPSHSLTRQNRTRIF